MSHRSRDPAERELQGPNAACPFGYQLALLDRNRNFSCTQAFRFIKFLLMLGDRWHFETDEGLLWFTRISRAES